MEILRKILSFNLKLSAEYMSAVLWYVTPLIFQRSIRELILDHTTLYPR
jgi:hypothetical protein